MEPNQDPGEPQVTAPGTEDAILAALEGMEHLPSSTPETMEQAHEQLRAVQKMIGEVGLPDPGQAAEAPPESPPEGAQEEAPAEGEADGDEAADPEPAPEPATAEAYERALAALRRYKTPQTVIDGLTPDQAIAWGKHLAKIQADTDKAFTDLKARPKPEAEAETQEKPDGEPTREPEPSPDLDEVSNQAAELLGLSKEEGKTLGRLFDAVTAPLKRELAERDQRDQRRDNAITELLVERARGRLAGRFPKLGEAEPFKAVMTKAAASLASGQAGNLDEAMEDACRVVFFDDAVTAQVSSAQRSASTRAKASPTPPSARSSPVALSQDERESKVLELLDAGMTGDEAAKAAGW